jgi:hypothetical protein
MCSTKGSIKVSGIKQASSLLARPERPDYAHCMYKLHASSGKLQVPSPTGRVFRLMIVYNTYDKVSTTYNDMNITHVLGPG